MHIYGFEKLDVWQAARKFTKEIYQITKSFPKEEKFGLMNQIRRASISVCSNIAEGSARKTKKDKARFFQIAYASTLELLNQLIICNDLQYISDQVLLNLRNNIEEITNKLNALYRSQLND
jgi:four helix bundle protein